MRLLGHDDIEGAVEVLVRAFNELEARFGRPVPFQTFSQARATLQRALKTDPDGVWGAVRGVRKVVGVAVAYRRGDYVSIGPVAVHPMVQGQGIGRSLMRAVADANGEARCLALSQAGINPQSFALYRTEGYRVVFPEAFFAGTPVRLPAERGDVREAGRRDRDCVLSLDRELAAIDRAEDLEMLLGHGRAFVCDAGYLLTCRIGRELAVGPGAARDASTVEALLASALADVPEGGVVVRVPANGAAYDVLARTGLRPGGVGNIMAAGKFPTRTGEHVHPIFPEVI